MISELEGTLLKEWDVFSYMMLVAFEASGVIRFALLLMLWPVIRVLDMVGMGESSVKLMIFVAMAGVAKSEIESVARAVLPKFMMDDVDMDAWDIFRCYHNRVVVTKMPVVMVERFVKDHLRADEVIGTQLCVNRFGFATGFVKNMKPPCFDSSSLRPHLGMGRPTSTNYSSFLNFCKVSPYFNLLYINF